MCMNITVESITGVNRAAGEITGAASSIHAYNVLNGRTVAKKVRFEPEVAEEKSDNSKTSKRTAKATPSVSLPIINDLHGTNATSPSSNTSINGGIIYDERLMSGGVNQYKNAAEALKPIGNYPAVRKE